MAWAVFRQTSTGKPFFFATTHLEAGRSTAAAKPRLRQAKAVAAEIRDHQDRAGRVRAEAAQHLAEQLQRLERKAGGFPGWINGSYLDYIMMTRMRVLEWETVARLDGLGRFVGTIPSDHNLLRATVRLP